MEKQRAALKKRQAVVIFVSSSFLISQRVAPAATSWAMKDKHSCCTQVQQRIKKGQNKSNEEENRMASCFGVFMLNTTVYAIQIGWKTWINTWHFDSQCQFLNFSFNIFSAITFHYFIIYTCLYSLLFQRCTQTQDDSLLFLGCCQLPG